MDAIARGFVAVEPPAEVLAALADRVRAVRAAGLGDGLRWAREGWHATLQFLGRVDAPHALVDALGTALRDLTAPTVRLGGAGAFPRARRGTVLWIGFADGAPELGELTGRVAGTTARLGFDAEDRRFTPHITLARARAALDLRALVEAFGDEPVGPAWRVDDVVLVASRTEPDGARYTEVSRVPLGARAG